ncbi:MAG TPA: hypothetical protein VMA09_24160 [Candidatus Binataceae bacterium]|nr:hypothetical protein [Candidatus Binataceae bacterium]
MRISIVALSILIALTCVACGPTADISEEPVASNGCAIDGARICHDMRHTFASTPGQNVIRELIVPIRMPMGEPNIDVHCGINTGDQSITYVRIAQPSNLTFNDQIYLRSNGYCS